MTNPINTTAAVLPATGANMIQVNPALPCAMEGCHNLATVAWADPIMLGPNTGSYYVIPICRDCAGAALAQYGPIEDEKPEPILFIYGESEAAAIDDDDVAAAPWKAYLLSLEIDEELEQLGQAA